MAISIAEAETRRGTICAPRILKCQRKGGTAGPACGETPVKKLFHREEHSAGHFKVVGAGI